MPINNIERLTTTLSNIYRHLPCSHCPFHKALSPTIKLVIVLKTLRHTCKKVDLQVMAATVGLPSVYDLYLLNQLFLLFSSEQIKRYSCQWDVQKIITVLMQIKHKI